MKTEITDLDLSKMTRDDVVPHYVEFIKTDASVVEINKRIIEKWSTSGLIYIKEKAWRIATPYMYKTRNDYSDEKIF